METGSDYVGVALVGEGGTSFADDGVECLDIRVDDGLVDERPERLRRQRFRRVGRKKNQAPAVGNFEPRFNMPTGFVDDEHDGSLAAGAGLFRKACEQRGEERFRDAVMHLPEGLAARRRGEGGDVEPIEAMMAMGDRPFAFGRTNAPCDGLQTEPVFVAGEDLDRPPGIFFGFSGIDRHETFLKSAASSCVADFGFFGRRSGLAGQMTGTRSDRARQKSERLVEHHP